MNFTIQSQIVTNQNNDTTLCFPIQTVRNIEKDLIRGDYCDSTSKAKDIIIAAQQEKMAAKDSMNNSLKGQINLFKQNQTLWGDVVEVRENEIKVLTKVAKKEKFWKNVYKIGCIVLPPITVYFTYKALR